MSSDDFNSFNVAVYPGDLPADSLYALFDENEIRRSVTTFTQLYNAATGKDSRLWRAPLRQVHRLQPDAPYQPGPSGINCPELRYADILLPLCRNAE